jgi:protein SCO1/2
MRRAAIALVLIACCAGCGGAAKPVLTGALLTPDAAPDFALRDQDGRTVTMAGQRGHWTVVTFLYTHCPDVCPLIAASLNGAVKSDAGRTAGLRALAVSVDPARDTPAAVHHYVVTHRLAPRFRYLIGSAMQLERVWADFHVAALPGADGLVTHSTFEILIDPHGHERLLYDATITTAELVDDLNALHAVAG